MHARLICAIAAMGLLASPGWAQTGLRSASLPDRTPMNPIPSTQMGLRSASLPDRSPAEPIPPPQVDRFRARPRTFAPRFDRGRRFRQGFPVGYGYAGDLYVPAGPERPTDVLPNGFLDLRVQPGTAEVHVDGYYMGTADDFRRVIPGRALEAGPHHVELRAAGHETVAFDVHIPPNEIVTYRSDLQARRAIDPPPLAVPGVPKTFYVIPGCYAGDKPPRTVTLPRGCDPSKVRRIPPTIGPIARLQG
ncbi:MAG: hypothetical protein ACRD26_01590 [Vicinamibacterales bacterium]